MARTGGNLLGRKPLGIKAFGLGPIFRIAVTDKGRDKDQRPGGDAIAIQHIVHNGFAGEQIRGGVETKYFMDHLLHVSQFGKIRESR